MKVSSVDWTSICNIGKDVFTYMLSFAYRSTYRLALVSKSFYWIIKSKVYWKYIAGHYLKHHIPSIVFKEVDFFYGLEEDDPPYLYLGCILSYPLVKDAVIMFTSITNNGKTWGLNWTRSAKGHTIKSFAITTVRDNDNELKKTILVTYFHEPQFRKNAFVYEGNNIRLLYSEFWNAERTRIWCGLPKKTLIVASGIKDSLPANPEPLEPFGTWITE